MRGNALSSLLIALAAALFANAGSAQWLLQPESEQVVAGEVLDVFVYVVNDSASPIAEGLPQRLPANVRSPDNAATITLEAVDPPADLEAPIAPGMFRKQRYRVRIPENMRGTVQITLERLPAARLHVAVDVPAAAPAATAPRAAAAQARPSESDPILRVDTVPEPALSPHEPMYFVYGSRGKDSARVQLSFKYRLFDERGVLARYLPGIDGIHFGYTQTSLWDIGSDSSPFRDTSYKPSFFYYNPQIASSGGGRFLMGLETGYEHESNGRDGERSRSIDIAYIRPSWRWFIDDEHYVAISPKIYAYLDKKDNPDIDRYRGHVDLNLRYGKRDGWLFSTTLRKGRGPGESIQLDASYPIRQPFFANAGGFLHFQYFEGYGETLLDYNVRHGSQFRVGFSIVR